MATPSPCVGLCQLDPATSLCTGCARSGAEIAAWKDASPAFLAQVWADLPARRDRMGLRLHRLGWSADDVATFVRGTLQAGGGSWVVGGYGGVGEFSVGPDEVCEVGQTGAELTAVTRRGAIRFEVADRVRVFAVRAEGDSPAPDRVVLGVARSQVREPPHATLTALGPDRSAIRAGDRHDTLFDLGLNSVAGAFCVRTAAPDLITMLERRVGQSWADLLVNEGPQLVRSSPTRVVVSPLVRVEVGTPITPPGSRTPRGPHTHLLPDLLALGRATPPGWDLPDSFVPAAIYYPDPLNPGSTSGSQ